MTRGEAIDKFARDRLSGTFAANLVDGLVAVGVLHLETAEDIVRVAAAERLMGTYTQTMLDSVPTCRENRVGVWQKISRAGALEILDVLLKSGFKITRE